MRYLVSLCLLLTTPTLAQPVERIISLAPHTTELAFAAGLGDKIIAVSKWSDYPEQAKSLEQVASFRSVKLERIIELEPDLVIAWPTGKASREIQQLIDLGINVYQSKAMSLDAIPETIRYLSQFTDDPNVGLAAANQFELSLAELKQKFTTEQPVRYFYQLSEKPIVTVSQDRWPSEVFAFCGGVNVFEGAEAPYPQVGLEQIVLANPQVIFHSGHAVSDGVKWNNWKDEVDAVKHQHVWSLTTDWINRSTPRTLYAIEEVCEYLEQVRLNQNQ